MLFFYDDFLFTSAFPCQEWLTAKEYKFGNEGCIMIYVARKMRVNHSYIEN